MLIKFLVQTQQCTEKIKILLFCPRKYKKTFSKVRYFYEASENNFPNGGIFKTIKKSHPFSTSFSDQNCTAK